MNIKNPVSLIFDALCKADRRLNKESKDDRLFFQNWFGDVVNKLEFSVKENGINQYPDFEIEKIGFDAKGLSIKNKAFSAKTIEFNSTIPCGFVDGQHYFVVFGLYDFAESELKVHSLSLCHLNLIQDDPQLALNHKNISVKGIGSYGDGLTRIRKMYKFSHPLMFVNGFEKYSIIVPEGYPKDESLEWKSLSREGRKFCYHICLRPK